MKLTVLGCYGPYPPAGGCCSGYLVETADTRVLVDCGNGVLSRLQQYCPLGALDAIILSHLHPDHCSDLFIMRYALEMAFNRKERAAPLALYAPAEPVAEFERLPYKNAFRVETIDEGASLSLGSLKVTFCRGVHAVPSLAVLAEAGGAKLVYSGDTEYSGRLEQAADAADLFLCEANYLQPDLEAGLKNHLSASQAAKMAIAAGVKRLVLTHHQPNRDPALSFREAALYYPAAELALEGTVYEIT